MAVVGLAIAVVHTPPVARWGREWAVRQVSQRWDLDLVSSRLSYNLFTGRVSVDDVRLAAPGHTDAPFFSAKRVTAYLPLVILRGTFRLRDLQVDEGRVRLVRENGTLVNLPKSSGQPPPANARRFDLRGLQVRGLDVDYEDRTGDVDVQVRGLRAALSGSPIGDLIGPAGTIDAASVMVRMGAQRTTSGALAGRMSFDGSNVTLQSLTVPFPEAKVTADGRITRVLDDTHFALTLGGTLDLAAIAAWTPPPVPVSGPGTFTGTFEGPLGGYELRAKFASEATTIARVPEVALAGELSLTSPRAVIAPLTITTPPQGPAGKRGVFDGRFVYTFGDPGGSDLTGTYRDFDLDMALALYDQDPVSVAAWEQGTVSLGRDTRTAPLRMHATGRSAPLVRADRVTLDGTWDATLAGERWFVRHDHRLLDSARASGTLQWQAGGDVATTALNGPVALEVGDVGAAIRAARASGIGMSASLVALKGTARGTLTVGGTLARIVVSGPVESRDLVLPHGARATATADIVYDEDSLSATAFALETPGARVSGHVRMGMVSSRLEGAFDAAVSSLPDVLAPFGDYATTAGTLQLAGTIGGTTTVPDVPLRLSSTPITYGTQAIGTLEGEARLVGTDVRIDHLVLDQGPGQLRASGRIDYDTYAYDLTAAGRGLTWAQPVAGSEIEAVTVDLSFGGAGTFTAPGGTGTLTVSPTGGLADFTGPANVRWNFVHGSAAISAFWPKLRAWADAEVEPRAPYAFRGTAIVSKLDVQPLALTAGLLTSAVSGTVDLSAAYDGQLSDLTSASAFLNLQAAELSVGGLPVRLEHPARATVRVGDVTIDDLAVRAGASTLTVAGRFRDGLDEPLRATFAGQVADVVALARAVDAVPAETTATGALTATWECRGSIATARATIDLADGTVTMAGLPPLEALKAAATFDGSAVSVQALSAQWQGGAINGTARIPRELLEPGTKGRVPTPGRVDLTVVGLTEKALAPWLPASAMSSMTGRVSATLGLDLTTAEFTGMAGRLVIDEASVVAAGVPISQTRPSSLSLSSGVLTFDDMEFGAGVPVRIGGNVIFGDATALNVWITGTPGLRPFSVLSPQLSVDGDAVLDVWVTGTPAAPQLTGTITLDDAEVVLRDPRVIASDISGPIVFRGDRFSLPGLKGFLNGGDVEASGSVRFTGVDVMTGDIVLQARGVAIEYPQNVDSEIDALLTYAVGASPILRGDVRILRSAYRATISIPALVAFNATRVVDVAAGPTYLDTLRLDVAVSTEDDMIVDNNYGRFEAGADLRLQGTVARPGVTGRAELREGGEIFLLNGVYRLVDSTISFTDPTAIQPDMNITMVTPSGRYESSVTLTGTLERLQTSVTSTDQDADPTLLNVLLGGSNSLTGSDAVALLSGELLGVTGRALGLDALRIERGFNADFVRQDPGLIAEDADPSARLTVSKRLRQDVEVILSRKLSGSGDLSAVVSYRPWRGVEMRATSRDNNDRAYAVRHELTFGGGAATAPARERPTATVTGVRITGATPEDERALLGELSLRDGKRFDFIKWREDAERLETWYRQRGFLEARVRPSRAPGDDPERLVLTYGIIRGPHTELVVNGTPVSRKLRQELEQTWSRGVFDDFRKDEARRAVAYDLVRRDIVNGRVDAEVTVPAEGEKRIVITVQGGEQVRERVLEFPGSEALTAKDLDATLRGRWLTDYVWVDPLSAIEPIQTRYSEAGYRDTAVTPGAIRVDAGRAVLPIAVAEGPLTLVSQVTVTGVGEDLATPVHDIVHPLEGRAFRNVQVDDARRRIEALYRARGFNHVTVTPSVSISKDARAALAVAVAPGLQQRLQAVVVDDTGRTRPSAVANALRLEPGTPVDFAKWAEARKRVFDTNVFRQVEVRPEVVEGAAAAEGVEPVNARVTVTEWPAWRLRYGLQLNDIDQSSLGESLPRARNIGAVADLQNRNAFGRAFTFGLYGRVERRLQSSNAYLTFPTLFGRALQTNVFGSAAQQDTAFDDNGDPLLRRTKSIASVEQRVRRGRAMEIAYGYRYSREVLRPFDPEDPFFQVTKIGRFTGSAFFDRRNDPFDATTGWFASLNVERLSFFGFDSDSVKVLGTVYGYRTLGAFTLASAARIGTSFVDPLLFAERFFVGGADTVRGYRQSSAGPRDLSGLASGGNSMLVLNQEVRAPVYKWIRGVVFVDAGNVYLAKRPTFTDLQVGYGAGLRLNTPFSLFRLDLGVPSRGGGVRWYIGIGQVF